MNNRVWPRRYQIRVDGQPDEHWFRMVDGLRVTHLPNGETLLSAWMTDQAALFGLLNHIGDLGLDLLAVTCVDAPTARCA